MDKDRYIEHLEDLIHDLHSALELTVYDIEENDAKGDTVRKAQQFWDDFCSLKRQHHLYPEET
jgi:hypothetical protein